MTIKEKLKKAKFIMDCFVGAYKDDRTTGEYQDSKKASKLVNEVLKAIG
jgi:hypothetical protein